MTRERIYAWLLCLYPRRFQHDYGDAMFATFREWSDGYRGTAWSFWRRLFVDVMRSAIREHVDEWTNGAERLALRWVTYSGLGAAASGLAIGLLLMAVESFFPDWRDPAGYVHNTSRNLPSGVYGLVIGLVIGGSQAFALRTVVSQGLAWTVGTAAAVALGFQVRVDLLGPFSYLASVLLVGAIAGIVQSLIVRLPVAAALRWIAWNSLAVPVGIFTAIAMVPLAGNGPPRSEDLRWMFFAFAFFVGPMTVGLVMGIVTVGAITGVATLRVPADKPAGPRYKADSS